MAVHAPTLPQISLRIPLVKFYLKRCPISTDRVQSADAMVQFSLQQLLCSTLASEQEPASEEHPGIKVWAGLRAKGGDYPELLQ